MKRLMGLAMMLMATGVFAGANDTNFPAVFLYSEVLTNTVTEYEGADFCFRCALPQERNRNTTPVKREVSTVTRYKWYLVTTEEGVATQAVVRITRVFTNEWERIWKKVQP